MEKNLAGSTNFKGQGDVVGPLVAVDLHLHFHHTVQPASKSTSNIHGHHVDGETNLWSVNSKGTPGSWIQRAVD